MGFLDKFKDAFQTQDEDYYDDIPMTDLVTQEEEKAPVIHDHKRNKVVNINATTQLSVVLVKPELFDEVKIIADHLNSKRTVLLNLESASKENAKRIVDFLSGVAYANGGQMKKVANSTFIITPFNVDLMGDVLMEEIENFK